MALKYGADLVWGPETVDRSMIGTTRHVNERTGAIEWTRVSSNQIMLDEESRKESVIYRLHPEREGRQHIFQIGSANPVTAVAAAKLVAKDVAGIDLNSGCPKPFSTSGGMGAALLKTPDLLCSILTALVEEVGRPNEIGISVKIRLLETAEETRTLVERLVKTGITGLTIHCRTTPMRPREKAIREQLSMIGDICREAGVACLMNGDVASRDEALQLALQYNVDGAMIATAAEKNPSVFRPEELGGIVDSIQVAKEYIDLAMQVENQWGNTKFLLQQMIPGKRPEHQTMLAAKSFTDLVKGFDLGEEKLDLARRADQALDLGEFVKPKMSKAERKRAIKLAAQKADEAPASNKRTAEQAGLDEQSSVKYIPMFDQPSLDPVHSAISA